MASLTYSNKASGSSPQALALQYKTQDKNPLPPIKSQGPISSFLSTPTKGNTASYTATPSWQETLNNQAPVPNTKQPANTEGGMNTPTGDKFYNPYPISKITGAKPTLPYSSAVSPLQGSSTTQSPTQPSPFINSSNNGYVNSSGSYVPPTVKTTPSTFQTATKSLADQSGSERNLQTGTAIGGLQGIAKDQTSQVKQAQEEYNKFAKASPFLLSDVRNNPNVAAEVSVGRGQALGQTLSAEQQALAQNVTNALAGQGQQITAGNEAGGLAQTAQSNAQSALTQAGNLTQPTAGASFFGSPETGNVVGSGSGGTGNNLIDSSLNNALNIIASGGSSSDAMASLVGGDVAKTAFIKKMQEFDPSWNPTSSNAIAMQNMSQGQKFQNEAAQLSTTLKQLDTLTPVVTGFIDKSGLNNQENPFYNKAIKEYTSQLKNPADVASLNAMMADVKTYTAQILGASGLNPTEVSATVNSFDPSLLNARQLTSFLSNLKNLGQVRLQPIQESSKSSYGGQGAFVGSTATPSTVSNSAQPNSPSPLNTNNPVIQGLAGQAMQAPQLVEGLVGTFLGGVAPKIVGAASKIFR